MWARITWKYGNALSSITGNVYDVCDRHHTTEPVYPGPGVYTFYALAYLETLSAGQEALV